MFDYKFKPVKTIDEAAYMINLPHRDEYNQEEFDELVARTKKIIQDIINMPYVLDLLVTPFMIRTIHRNISEGYLPACESGTYRTIPVRLHDRVISYDTIGPNLDKLMTNVQNAMFLKKLTNLYICGIYREIEEIHPFTDFNGRVGGIWLVCMTYLIRNCQDDTFGLVPLQ